MLIKLFKYKDGIRGMLCETRFSRFTHQPPTQNEATSGISRTIHCKRSPCPVTVLEITKINQVLLLCVSESTRRSITSAVAAWIIAPWSSAVRSKTTSSSWWPSGIFNMHSGQFFSIRFWVWVDSLFGLWRVRRREIRNINLAYLSIQLELRGRLCPPPRLVIERL